MLIYKIINLINGMSYVGQTNRNIEERWLEHCKPSLATRSYLSNAIQKYGKDNFKIEQLAKADSQEELDLLENKAIMNCNTLFPNGYNLMTGGNGGGRVWSEESKQKLSKTNKGKPFPALALKNSAIARKDRRSFGEQVQCTGCLKIKDKIEFHKNKTTPTGYESLCKPCRKAYRSLKKSFV